MAKAATRLQEVEQILQDINSTFTNNPHRSYSMYISFTSALQTMKDRYNRRLSTTCSSVHVVLYYIYMPKATRHNISLTHKPTQ